MARTRKCYVRPPEAQSSINQIWRLTHSPDAGSTPSVPSLRTPSRGRGHNHGALFATLRQLVSSWGSPLVQGSSGRSRLEAASSRRVLLLPHGKNHSFG